MDKFELVEKIKKSRPVIREDFIEDQCRGKKVLDLGCIRHSADFAMKDPTWLHRKIKQVATEVVGVDYLPDEVKKINAQGFNVSYGDVTQPLDLTEQFEVIVAGDLIEHLENFGGFFANCKRLLQKDGAIILSTPNPFYSELNDYVTLKGTFLINPEHTCWIDPQALSQLAERFGMVIDEIHYVKNSYKVKGLISETSSYRYDILHGTWSPESLARKISRRLTRIVFGILYGPYRFLTGGYSRLVRYSDYIAVLRPKA